jgi:hypothetical protein
MREVTGAVCLWRTALLGFKRGPIARDKAEAQLPLKRLNLSDFKPWETSSALGLERSVTLSWHCLKAGFSLPAQLLPVKLRFRPLNQAHQQRFKPAP